MSNNGEDIILSKKAIKLLPISLECKDHKNRYGGSYDIYEQAEGNTKGNEPVGVITDSFNFPLIICSPIFIFPFRKNFLKFVSQFIKGIFSVVNNKIGL